MKADIVAKCTLTEVVDNREKEQKSTEKKGGESRRVKKQNKRQAEKSAIFFVDTSPKADLVHTFEVMSKMPFTMGNATEPKSEVYNTFIIISNRA
ncbi:UNVERIFIED_CONTAM: hypothetical protein K2H54_050287 [Gekko kuhli]